MNIENQVCSLELAKKLKELGVKQKSYFRWIPQVEHRTLKPTGKYLIRHHRQRGLEDYSAFTVAELGEILPAEVGCPSYFTAKRHWCPSMQSEGGDYYFSFTVGEKQNMATGERHAFTFLLGNYDKNEANVRAEIVVYLAKKRCGDCIMFYEDDGAGAFSSIFTCNCKNSKEYLERIEPRFLACDEFKEKPDNSPYSQEDVQVLAAAATNLLQGGIEEVDETHLS